MSPAQTPTPTAAGELVPIAERLRYMQAFRYVLAVVVAIAALLAREALEVPAVQLGGVTAAYVAATTLAMVATRMSRSGATRLFGVVLMLDGVFLAWASYVTGGAGSPVRYLIVLHLIAVALLASYRTGMKLAMWHSILLLVVYYAQQAELLRPLAEDRSLGIGSPFEQLLGFSGVFWLAAIVTSSFSAVNERELRRRRYDLEALAVMARRLEEVAGSAAVAETLVGSVCDTFDIQRAVVLAAADGRSLSVLAGHGDVRSATGEFGPGSVVRSAMESGSTRLVARLDPAADAALRDVLPDARNLVVVPLSAGKLAIGVIVVEHPLRAASRIERRVVGMLERFAAHAALALRNAWLLEEIQHLAATDALTGIANRATFQHVLGQELSRAQRSGGPLGLLLLDLDHFKRLNDTYGHVAGDEVLRRVAAVLDETCRGFDTPARYGGEEFAVVFPGRDPGEVAGDLEEIRGVIERYRMAVRGQDRPKKAEEGARRRGAGNTEKMLMVTVSIGLAGPSREARTPQQVVKAADEALYRAKKGGRNRLSR